MGPAGASVPAGPCFFFMQPKRPIIVSDMKMAVFAATRVRNLRRMASYRLYALDGVSRVASGEWIEAGDDQQAIEAARKRFGDGHCEIWQGPRLVARLERVDGKPRRPRSED